MPSENMYPLTITVSRADHKVLKAAARSLGQSTATFVVRAALERAALVVEGEGDILLTPRESERLATLLEAPPQRNAVFLAAQAKYEAATQGKSNQHNSHR